MKNISKEVCPNVRAVEIAIDIQGGEVKKRLSSNESGGDPVPIVLNVPKDYSAIPKAG